VAAVELHVPLVGWVKQIVAAVQHQEGRANTQRVVPAVDLRRRVRDESGNQSRRFETTLERNQPNGARLRPYSPRFPTRICPVRFWNGSTITWGRCKRDCNCKGFS
jgi:hypothetical protein